MSNEVKVYILADTEEDYNNTVEKCRSIQEDFVEKHKPEWTTSPPVIVDEHVEFIDSRKYSVWAQTNGYEFSLV